MKERYGTIEWFENRFQQSDDDPWGHNFRGTEQYRYDLIINMITKHAFEGTRINSEFKILDIGCAIGNFSSRLYELNKNLISIDISKTAIEKAKAKFNYIDFRVGSLPDPNLQKNAFNLITCLEVLYYMNEHEQRNFLDEMSSLLKMDGRGVVTSVIGGKPYFKSKELVKLLSEFFEIKAIEYYGSKGYAKVDEILFTKYQQMNKIQRILTLNHEELRKEFGNSNNPKKKMIESIMSFVIKFEASKFITYILLKIIKKMIRIVLGLKFSVKISHFISKILSLEPTHTFVLVAKR